MHLGPRSCAHNIQLGRVGKMRRRQAPVFVTAEDQRNAGRHGASQRYFAQSFPDSNFGPAMAGRS